MIEIADATIKKNDKDYLKSPAVSEDETKARQNALRLAQEQQAKSLMSMNRHNRRAFSKVNKFRKIPSIMRLKSVDNFVGGNQVVASNSVKGQ